MSRFLSLTFLLTACLTLLVVWYAYAGDEFLGRFPKPYAALLFAGLVILLVAALFAVLAKLLRQQKS